MGRSKDLDGSINVNPSCKQHTMAWAHILLLLGVVVVAIAVEFSASRSISVLDPARDRTNDRLYPLVTGSQAPDSFICR